MMKKETDKNILDITNTKILFSDDKMFFKKEIKRTPADEIVELVRQASQEIKSDKHLMILCCSKNIDSLPLVDETLRDNENFFLDVLHIKFVSPSAIDFCSDRLSQDIPFLIKVLNININCLIYMEAIPKKNKELIKVALSLNAQTTWKHMDRMFEEDMDILLSTLILKPLFLFDKIENKKNMFFNLQNEAKKKDSNLFITALISMDNSSPSYEYNPMIDFILSNISSDKLNEISIVNEYLKSKIEHHLKLKNISNMPFNVNKVPKKSRKII